MLSNVVACKRSTIEKRPDVCQAFVEGLIEGLKYVYLNPEQSVEHHLESVKEFQAGTVSNQKVIEYGQAVSTALGMVPAFKNNGLGYMDPDLVRQTAQKVETYMGIKNMPKVHDVHQQVRGSEQADERGMVRCRGQVSQISAETRVTTSRSGKAIYIGRDKPAMVSMTAHTAAVSCSP